MASAQVVTDRDTGRSKGFGFVEFDSDDEGNAAIAGLNSKDMNGRSLAVNVARPREDRPTAPAVMVVVLVAAQVALTATVVATPWATTSARPSLSSYKRSCRLVMAALFIILKGFYDYYHRALLQKIRPCRAPPPKFYASDGFIVAPRRPANRHVDSPG